MKIEVNIDNVEQPKIRIIALTGKIGCGIEKIFNHLTSLKNVKKLKSISTLPSHLGGISSEEFLKKIIQGDIIEATFDANNIAWGIDISNVFSGYLYVKICTPQQINMLRESDRIELLPLEIDMSAEARMLHLLQQDKPLRFCGEVHFSDARIRTLCEQFLKDEKEYDKELLHEQPLLKFVLPNYASVCDLITSHNLTYAIKEYNHKNNCITNLDNFI